MGEAKRKRESAARGVAYYDIATGTVKAARLAGDPLDFGDRIIAINKERASGGRPVADVPCNGCRECCYHAGVDVHPELERPEDLAHLDLVEREDGSLWLRKREDGACVHLGPEGCTVYEHRPDACRAYDCRLYALMTVLDKFEGDHQQPQWLFQPKSVQSRAFMAACGFTGQMLFHSRRLAGEPCAAEDISQAVTGLPEFPKICEAFLTLAKASPEQQRTMLGYDPRTMTPERLTEMYTKLGTSPDRTGTV